MKQSILLLLGILLSQNIWAQITPKEILKTPYITNEFAITENLKPFSSPQAATKTSRQQSTVFRQEETSSASLKTRIADLEATIEKHQGHRELVEKLNHRLSLLKAEYRQLEENSSPSEKDQ